jgi:hypothetical protein
MISPNNLLNVLYISLIRSCGFIKETLKIKPLVKKKIFIMDCVSGFAFPPEDIKGVIYHKPPHNLEELKEIINHGIKKTSPDIIVLDSLSQFINFSHPSDKELKEIYNFLSSVNLPCTFILLYDNKMGLMKKLPEMDMILKLELVKEEPEWMYKFADKILRI